MDNLIEMIAAQQAGHEMDDVWMVGEQLKDICRREPGCVSILVEDLQSADMGIAKAAAKIKAYADSQAKGKKCVCVPPAKAEQILREFYGLPDAAAAVPVIPEAPKADTLVVDLDELWG